MLVKILKFSILKSPNKPTFMTNKVKNYFRVLEVISSLKCELEYKSGVGRIQKTCDLEVVALGLTVNLCRLIVKTHYLNRLMLVKFQT
jgi:hypothetical protein